MIFLQVSTLFHTFAPQTFQFQYYEASLNSSFGRNMACLLWDKARSGF